MLVEEMQDLVLCCMHRQEGHFLSWLDRRGTPAKYPFLRCVKKGCRHFRLGRRIGSRPSRPLQLLPVLSKKLWSMSMMMPVASRLGCRLVGPGLPLTLDHNSALELLLWSTVLSRRIRAPLRRLPSLEINKHLVPHLPPLGRGTGPLVCFARASLTMVNTYIFDVC
jgi:hypothetical protein